MQGIGSCGVFLAGGRCEGEGEKGRSHCWIRVHARSFTALWMGIMEGIVWARESVGEEESAAADVVGEAEAERVCGLCFRRTAVKNWCSDG